MISYNLLVFPQEDFKILTYSCWASWVYYMLMNKSFNLKFLESWIPSSTWNSRSFWIKNPLSLFCFVLFCGATYKECSFFANNCSKNSYWIKSCIWWYPEVITRNRTCAKLTGARLHHQCAMTCFLLFLTFPFLLRVRFKRTDLGGAVRGHPRQICIAEEETGAQRSDLSKSVTVKQYQVQTLTFFFLLTKPWPDRE